MGLLFFIPIFVLQAWTNRPILLVQTGQWKGDYHDAYLEHRRRSIKSTKIVIILLLLIVSISIYKWSIIVAYLNNY